MAFEVQAGGRTASPRELTVVSDQGVRTQPTPLQPARRRV
ncbi:hypothetical protein CD006_12370 [Enterobacter sp. 10-1]|nr:hypothetical protein CD006_12370 [Enterobacter sp. 10-1]